MRFAGKNFFEGKDNSMKLKNLDGNSIVLGSVYPKIEQKGDYCFVKIVVNLFYDKLVKFLLTIIVPILVL
ncbi:MAG: hypothetical protein COT34_01305 [Candidatus Nealsonbacteria bacterium CG08_land_8_20_14_0_20_43_11]|uniref:Uncharacterized protein n=1 Tax=Candidatus Nealsonbacteria bacterium CG08_land_8_20_14_0_20_43_11 TaxID=1974706 RepID=A0A2M6T0L0_9BACT|nr:MAG: hypothetical protein COT34_01305 [Candidatus Nealsonbacteria bacterium CG08_land_8_20_14_0_20_43_11]